MTLPKNWSGHLIPRLNPKMSPQYEGLTPHDEDRLRPVRSEEVCHLLEDLGLSDDDIRHGLSIASPGSGVR